MLSILSVANKPFMLRVIMLNVALLSVIMPSVVMLSVVAPCCYLKTVALIFFNKCDL